MNISRPRNRCIPLKAQRSGLAQLIHALCGSGCSLAFINRLIGRLRSIVIISISGDIAQSIHIDLMVPYLFIDFLPVLPPRIDANIEHVSLEVLPPDATRLGIEFIYYVSVIDYAMMFSQLVKHFTFGVLPD